MLSLYSCCSRLLQLICSRINVVCSTRTPPLQNYNVTPDFHHLRKSMIYLFPCSCAVVGVLRWINTYYLCAVCRVRAWYVFRVCSCVLRYGTFYLCLLVFIQSFMFGMHIITYGTIKIVFCYRVLIQQADFLLVNIYTLRNGLRDKELMESVSGNVADLAHFYA